MNTIHTHTDRRRTLVIVLCLLALNCLTGIVFLVLRPVGIPSLQEREKMRREPGELFGVSGDAYMFIAERPLHSWNNWHGGESAWVQAIELLNLPAVRSAKYLGDTWSRYGSERQIGSFKGDTWVRAWIYLAASSIQWLILGMIIGRVVKPRQRGRDENGSPWRIAGS